VTCLSLCSGIHWTGDGTLLSTGVLDCFSTMPVLWITFFLCFFFDVSAKGYIRLAIGETSECTLNNSYPISAYRNCRSHGIENLSVAATAAAISK